MSDSELKGKGCVCVCVCALSRVWLCDPTDCTLSGSSVHGSFLATILEWVTISPCKVSSWPRDRTSFSFICRQTAFQLRYLGNSKGKCTGGKFPVVRLVKNFKARGSQETIFWNAEEGVGLPAARLKAYWDTKWECFQTAEKFVT